MDDAILMLNRFDVPLQSRLQRDGLDNTVYSWLEDDLDTQTVTATGALSTSTYPVVDSSNLRVRDLLRMVPTVARPAPTGIYQVTAIADGTHFTRAMWAGTTEDATVANGEVFEVIGQVPYEGDDPQASRDGDPSSKTNRTSIFQEKVDASRAARKQAQYGISDPFTRAEARKMKELAIRLEKALLYSVTATTGTASTLQRTMNGLFPQITSNVVTGTLGTNNANIDTKLGDALQAAYGFGGSPTDLMVSPVFKRAFSAINPDKFREDRDDPGVGRVKSIYESDFGQLELFVNRHMPRNRALALSGEYVWLMVFDDWFKEPLAKTGDTEREQIVGEFSVKAKNEKAHAVVYISDM
jgi:hypothetical protein